MTDREKVIRGLECCRDVQSGWKDARYVCPVCPYTDNGNAMDDLISRWAAIDALTDTNLKRNVDSLCDGDMNRTRRAAQRVIAQLPSVNAVPVVHGRWIRYSEIFHDPEYTLVKCSVCGGESCCDANYCPDCGAKMDGERRDDDAAD